MGFYSGGSLSLFGGAFNDVGIKRALGQECGIACLFSLALEYFYKGPADYLSLLFKIYLW